MTPSEYNDINWIGMMCRINSVPKLEDHTYTWIFRILVLDLELMKHHHKIICYTPADVDPTRKTVTGFILEGTQFKKVTLPIPKVTYDYHFGSTDNRGKPGFTYDAFEPWAIDNGYKIYPEKSLRTVASDKLLTAEILSQCDKSMIPYTELFTRERAQLEKFLHNNNTIFIKPRFGSAGNGIFVLNKDNNRYLVDFYTQGEMRKGQFASPSEFLATLKSDVYDDYIIQEAIDCIRFDGRVFDVRVTMFKEREIWHSLNEVRLGAKGKEISNGSQGGEAVPTDVILHKLFPKARVPALIEKIKIASEKIATFINDHLHDKVTELALDVLIDAHENIYLAEINVKPGLCGGFTMYDHFFDMSEEENYLFENYAKKHGEYLAKSLLHKCQSA